GIVAAVVAAVGVAAVIVWRKLRSGKDHPESGAGGTSVPPPDGPGRHGKLSGWSQGGRDSGHYNTASDPGPVLSKRQLEYPAQPAPPTKPSKAAQPAEFTQPDHYDYPEDSRRDSGVYDIPTDFQEELPYQHIGPPSTATDDTGGYYISLDGDQI
ncbi:hypothetical protein EGW08_003395, partial [Elysia chlorotica]